MVKRISKKKLGSLLVERGIITDKQLKNALEIQEKKGGLIGQVLVDLGYVTEKGIVEAITAQYGFPYLPLESYEIAPEVIKIVPKNVASQFCLIPVDKIGKNLTIAMANPLSTLAIEDIELVSGLCVQVFISTGTEIRGAIERYYGKT